MKFAEHLGAHLTPEWREKYVLYDQLKDFLYDATESAPDSEDVNDEILHHHYAKFDEDFFQFCDSELDKVNRFFAEKLAEAIRRFNELEIEVASTGVERLKSIARKSMLPAEAARLMKTTLKTQKKKLNNMKFIIGEFYLSLMLIQNFQQLNFTAFRKILKKHDKIFRTTSGVEYRMEKVENSSFYMNKNIDELISNTETIAIEDLEGGDRTKAMKRLRVPPLSEKQKSTPAFFWGFFTGMWLILFFVIVTLGYTKETNVPGGCWNKSSRNISIYSNSSFNASISVSEEDLLHPSWEPALKFYRGFLIVIIMCGLLGINIHGWKRAGVNHVLIFELDPRHNLSSTELLLIASLFGVFWSVSCLLFIVLQDVLPVYTQPVLFSLFLLIFIFNPTKTFWYRSRRWLLRILLRIICAPFVEVRFADFWLADQLNSLVVAIRDFEWIICFYAFEVYKAEPTCVCASPEKNFFRPIVALLPAWFRFAQCLRRYYDTRKVMPHLVNAGKYFTSMMVTVLSTIASITETNGDYQEPLHIAWIVCLIVSTIYSLAWDLFMDWGVFAKNAGENYLLRDQIVYDYKIYYYLAIVGDVFLRALKPLTVTIGLSGFINHELFVFLLGTCELIRRFVWNFFRLENEHLNNVGEFRAVRDINIKPIESDRKDSSSQDVDEGKEKLSIEQMMDSETGPLPQRKVVQMLLNPMEIPMLTHSTEPQLSQRTSAVVRNNSGYVPRQDSSLPRNEVKTSLKSRKLSSITII